MNKTVLSILLLLASYVNSIAQGVGETFTLGEVRVDTVWLDSSGNEVGREVDFYELDFAFEEFKEFAKNTNKPYFVDFYASWCTPCKVMDELVYSNPEIAEQVNSKLLAYKVNVEFFAGMDISEHFEVQQYPTLLFFDAEGNMIGREEGFCSADGFKILLKKYYQY